MHTLPENPTDKTLVLLTETPAFEDERDGFLFAGTSGKLLRDTFNNLGMDISAWHLLSVFHSRPPQGDFKLWTANKTELKKLGHAPRGPQIQKRYLLPDYWPHVEETQAILADLNPDLIIALGAKAQWMLLGDDRIGTFRGSFFTSPFGQAISTYHPGMIIKQYDMLPIFSMDLTKAQGYLDDTLPKSMKRKFCISPTFAEISAVYSIFKSRKDEIIGVDIETAPGLAQMTTISFSFPDYGICIPIWDKDTAVNFWPTAEEEVKAWRWIDKFCKLPNPKVLQNGMYDMQYMLDAPIQLRLAGRIEDTAIMQHAYQPELKKDLGMLASLYLNEPCWKQMRTSDKDAKADD